MAIRIDKITNGRFGNKILQYNTLMQLANNYNIQQSCCNWEGNKFFKSIVPYVTSKNSKKLLFCKKIIENDKLDFNNFDYILDDPATCIHNTFLNVTKTDPRNFLELKDEYKSNLSDDIIHIGIHFRGNDIIIADGNNGREIHEFKYYKNSIDYITHKSFLDNGIRINLLTNNYLFILCTDDLTFNSYIKTKEYLENNKYNFKLGPSTQNLKNHYIYDWSILSECDILINSSSTFCITAGFIGKKNKYIIHSKDWIDKNIKHIPWNNNITGYIEDYKIINFRYTFDNFWIDISNNNNYYYYNILI